MRASTQEENLDVFINCPFDDSYRPLFRAIVFAVIACGFRARSALEITDAAGTRLEKIYRIVKESRRGIHDISRTELDPINQLPRFNMPFELGLFLGCRQFGGKVHRSKLALVLDVDRYRYQKFISDLAGVDVEPHGNDVDATLVLVRDWLRNSPGKGPSKGGEELKRIYKKFLEALPTIAEELHVSEQTLTFADYEAIVVNWLRLN